MNIITDNYKLYHGDCLEIMDLLINRGIQVDAIICDPPYGTTSAKCDKNKLELQEMWNRLNKLIKPSGAIVLFGSQPFTTELISSNLKSYKYNWVWKKTKPSGFAHSKNMPMKITEDICVFSNAPIGHKSQLKDRRMEYNPQGVTELKEKEVKSVWHGEYKGSRENQVGKRYMAMTGFPNNLLEFPNIAPSKTVHPFQKPIDLLEYLIKTYTNENETVLDFTMGSGSTGVACLNTNRKFIGIELDENYFDIAINRIFEDYNKINN